MLLNGVSQVWTECGNFLSVVDGTGVPSDLKLLVQWPRGYTGELQSRTKWIAGQISRGLLEVLILAVCKRELDVRILQYWSTHTHTLNLILR